MLYFENYLKSEIGFNNQVISYTLCISLSNFLNRDFFFGNEYPSNTPPDYAVNSGLKDRFEFLVNSRRSLVSDLIKTPARRIFEIDRNVENKICYQDIMERFMTTQELQQKYENTLFWDFFRITRKPLIKEELQSFDLIEVGEKNLVNMTYFYFLNKDEKLKLLNSAKIKYMDGIERLAKRISNELGKYNSLHVRLGDFLIVYAPEGFGIKIERFRNYLAANIIDPSLPILIATDALHEKQLFAEMLKGYSYTFIDELIINEYYQEFSELEFTDFNVLTVLNQLLCANSEEFVGTSRSSFTGIIHRLRQERFGKNDFNFIPDDRVYKLLDPEYKIKPDLNGFFQWNRYSVFSRHFSYPGWMREWDFDLTYLDDPFS